MLVYYDFGSYNNATNTALHSIQKKLDISIKKKLQRPQMCQLSIQSVARASESFSSPSVSGSIDKLSPDLPSD